MIDATTEWPGHFSPEVVPRAPSSDALSSVCVALEAWRRGLTVTFESSDLRKYSISDGRTTIAFNCALPTSLTSREDALRLQRKWATSQVLEAHGVPVPRSVLLEVSKIPSEEIRQHAERIGYPLVLKPNVGSVGRGVFVDLRSWNEVQDAVQHLQSMGKDKVILQSYHQGDDLRVLVIGDRVVAAVRRVPANVMGDGTHRVDELIKMKNSERRKNPFLSNGRIRVDHEVDTCLEEQELTIESVPAAGQSVYLRKVANASAGGDVIDVTWEIPDALKQAAVNAVKIMPNIKVSGVDILYDESSGDFVIIEMNRRPHIAVNMYPTVGMGVDVPEAFVDYFFPGSSRHEHRNTPLLRFDMDLIRSALQAQITDAIVLAPLPEHRFPYRRIVRFDGVDEGFRVSPLQQDRILTVAEREGVSGQLRRRRGRVELLVAGRREASAAKLVETVEGILQADPSGNRRWTGALTHSFTISPGLART